MSNRTRNARDYVIGEDVEVSDVDLGSEHVIVNGERLTDERVEQMAAVSLRLALAREANLIPGGKSLSGGSKHSPVVQTRVSETTRDKLQEIAEAQGFSVSKLTRRILDQYVEDAMRVDDYRLANPEAVNALRTEDEMLPKPPRRRR